MHKIAADFLDQWLGVANDFLQKHADTPYGTAVREVTETVNPVLLVYSDGDNWPVDETIALFTKQLRTYYADNPKDTTVQSASDLLPASPAMLLTQIARVTGEIPDFVKKGHPKPRSVIAKWERFEAAVKSFDRSLRMQSQEVKVGSLFNDAPYAVIQLAVRPPAAATKVQGPGFVVTAFTPDQVIRAAADSSDVDSLLLLAALGRLDRQQPGSRCPDRDARKNLEAESNTWRGLENLFASHLRAREQARLLLQKMMTKAKSPELVDALHELNVPVSPQSASGARQVPAPAEAAPTSAAAKESNPTAANASDVPVYQGASAGVATVFAMRRRRIAKLEEAIALVTLAAQFRPKITCRRFSTSARRSSARALVTRSSTLPWTRPSFLSRALRSGRSRRVKITAARVRSARRTSDSIAKPA